MNHINKYIYIYCIDCLNFAEKVIITSYIQLMDHGLRVECQWTSTFKVNSYAAVESVLSTQSLGPTDRQIVLLHTWTP